MQERKWITVLIPAVLLFGITSFASPAAAGSAKVEVCHFPPGNPDNFHTITISEKAFSAHLAHGDLGEACNALCATICDDGDKCTIDDTGDCEEVGCPTSSTPVDCNDQKRCTDDSCAPASGCVNTPIVCTAPDLCTMSACAPDTGECVAAAVVCGAGEVCDLGTGSCVGCPCFPDGIELALNPTGDINFCRAQAAETTSNPNWWSIRTIDNRGEERSHELTLTRDHYNGERWCILTDVMAGESTGTVLITIPEIEACHLAAHQFVAAHAPLCSWPETHTE
jgi:hypothetical protein